MLSRKKSVLEIPLDKELNANCLLETRTKLGELIPAAMVDYGLKMVSHDMVNFGPQKSANFFKVCWGRVEYQAGGGVHLNLRFFFFFFFFFCNMSLNIVKYICFEAFQNKDFMWSVVNRIFVCI